MPRFLLQIVENDAETNRQFPIARLRAGGPLERDLIESITAAIVAKGIGVFKTKAQVTTAIREGITETITALKQKTIPIA